jgi:hypothetical protein
MRAQRRERSSGAARRRVAAALGVAAIGLAAGAAGCGFEDRRVLPRDDQARAATPALGGGESESDVRALLGPPDRVIESTDAATGRRRAVWVYERAVDPNGSLSVRRITFTDGVAQRDVQEEDPRPVRPAGPGPTPTRDRTSGRDMDW